MLAFSTYRIILSRILGLSIVEIEYPHRYQKGLAEDSVGPGVSIHLVVRRKCEPVRRRDCADQAVDRVAFGGRDGL